MADRYLFVTGKLAAPALRGTLERADLPFEYDIAVMKITVAALMTPDWIARRLEVPPEVTRIMIPGLCQGEPAVLTEQFDVPAEKGPADLKRLPAFFGQADARSRYGPRDIRIFAEINSVQHLDRDRIVEAATYYRDAGADVIDLGLSLDRNWLDEGPDTIRRAQVPRLHAQHRHARPRRDPHGRRGRRGLCPQPQRAQPPCGAAAARDPGADPRHARRPRQPRREHRAICASSASRSSSTRSSSRSGRASPRASAAISKPAAATPTSRCSWGSAT